MRAAMLGALTDETGCVFDPTPIGGMHRTRCPNDAAKIKLLNSLATKDAKYDPRVRAIATREIVPRVRGELTPAAVGRAIHEWVRDGVRYIGEGIETFQSAYDTARLRVGDCDDHARLVLALARTLGLRARLVTPRRADGVPVHAVAQIWDGADWRWAETTIHAEWGEEPVSAKRRLAATSRTDIGSSGQLGDLEAVGETSVGILAELAGRSDIAPQLTPIVRMGAALLAKTAGEYLRGIGTELVEQVAGQAMSFASSTIKTAANSIGAAADVVPFVSTVVDLVNLGSALDDAYAAQAAQDVREACTQYYEDHRPAASDTNVGLRPVDIFVLLDAHSLEKQKSPPVTKDGRMFGDVIDRSCGYVVKRPKAPAVLVDPTYVGIALRAWTETKLTAKELKGLRILLGNPKLGLDAKTQDAFRRLRLAIEGNWRLDKSRRLAEADGDGGMSLWPLYLDLLSAQFRQHRLDERFCRFLYQFIQLGGRQGRTITGDKQMPDSVGPALAAAGLSFDLFQTDAYNLVGSVPKSSEGKPTSSPMGINCYALDPRPVTETFGLVERWLDSVEPRWKPDQDALHKLQADLTATTERLAAAKLTRPSAKNLAKRIAGKKNSSVVVARHVVRRSANVGLSSQAHQRGRAILIASGMNEASLAELQTVGAIATLESSYGNGWTGAMVGSNNWGANQCGSKACNDVMARWKAGDLTAQCPPGTTMHEDSSPQKDGTQKKYRVCFVRFVSPAAGARALLQSLTAPTRPLTGAVLASGSARKVAEAMYTEHYYEGFSADRENAIDTYAKTIAGHAKDIAAAMGEPLAVTLDGGSSVVAPVVGGVALVGVGLAVWHFWPEIRRAMA